MITSAETLMRHNLSQELLFFSSFPQYLPINPCSLLSIGFGFPRISEAKVRECVQDSSAGPTSDPGNRCWEHPEGADGRAHTGDGGLASEHLHYAGPQLAGQQHRRHPPQEEKGQQEKRCYVNISESERSRYMTSHFLCFISLILSHFYFSFPHSRARTISGNQPLTSPSYYLFSWGKYLSYAISLSYTHTHARARTAPDAEAGNAVLFCKLVSRLLCWSSEEEEEEGNLFLDGFQSEGSGVRFRYRGARGQWGVGWV